MSDDKTIKQEHPSFGTCSIGRWQGSSHRLFGSALAVNHGIRLTICQARVDWHLNKEWIHGGKEIVEIDMTEAQFGQLLSSFGVGEGVPVTISYVRDVGQVKAPAERYIPATERIQQEFSAEQKELADKMRGITGDIKKILAKPSIGKGDREEILKIVDKLADHLEHSMPFLMKSLQETAEKVVNEARTEISSFAERTIREKGLEHMRDQFPKPIGLEKK